MEKSGLNLCFSEQQGAYLDGERAVTEEVIDLCGDERRHGINRHGSGGKAEKLRS